jgi:hypothetical protein
MISCRCNIAQPILPTVFQRASAVSILTPVPTDTQSQSVPMQHMPMTVVLDWDERWILGVSVHLHRHTDLQNRAQRQPKAAAASPGPGQ